MNGMPKMQKKQNRPKNLSKSFAKLFKYIKKYLWMFILSIVLSSVGAVLTIYGPKVIGEITDAINAPLIGMMGGGSWVDIDINLVNSLGIELVVIYLVSILCSYVASLIMVQVTLNVSKKMRKDLEHKINTIPLSYFSKVSYGDVLSRMTNDVDTITEALSNSISSIISALCQFIGCLIMMFATEWLMALTAIVSSLIGFVLMFLIMGKSQKYFVARQKSLGDLNGYIEEIYAGHEVVKVTNSEEQIKQKFSTLNKKVKDANFKSQFISGMMPSFMSFIGNLGYVAVCIVGAIGVINGNFLFGVISSFIIYVRLFTQPLSTISQGASQLQSGLASSERVLSFLEEEDLPLEENKTNVISKPLGNVDFEHVKFAYADQKDKLVIKDFTCHIKAGQKVAIVGPTGAGKTTLVNLLMRFYESTEGKIFIDGVETSELSRSEVHSLFGMVLQDTWLFEGTIKENLVYNCPNVSFDKVQEACKACEIDTFINSLKDGYNTVLSENTTVSEGQKQLITIARAMIQNSPMLILDEATSNVDTRTEIDIQKAMDRLTSSRTSFVIAHRLSTIKNADVILVMKEGDIIEQGNHEELLAKNGFYASLYNSQFDENSDGSIDSIVSLKKALA